MSWIDVIGGRERGEIKKTIAARENRDSDNFIQRF